MPKYKIKIALEKDGYVFQLWYCGKQPMGYSKYYDSLDNCKKGFEKFKDFLIRNNITKECKYLKLEQIDKRQYQYTFIDENSNVIYKSRIIEIKKSCKDSMISTCKNIINGNVDIESNEGKF